jgi:hypothetical protein
VQRLRLVGYGRVSCCRICHGRIGSAVAAAKNGPGAAGAGAELAMTDRLLLRRAGALKEEDRGGSATGWPDSNSLGVFGNSRTGP